MIDIDNINTNMNIKQKWYFIELAIIIHPFFQCIDSVSVSVTCKNQIINLNLAEGAYRIVQTVQNIH